MPWQSREQQAMHYEILAVLGMTVMKTRDDRVTKGCHCEAWNAVAISRIEVMRHEIPRGARNDSNEALGVTAMKGSG